MNELLGATVEDSEVLFKRWLDDMLLPPGDFWKALAQRRLPGSKTRLFLAQEHRCPGALQLEPDVIVGDKVALECGYGFHPRPLDVAGPYRESGAIYGNSLPLRLAAAG